MVLTRVKQQVEEPLSNFPPDPVGDAIVAFALP